MEKQEKGYQFELVNEELIKESIKAMGAVKGEEPSFVEELAEKFKGKTTREVLDVAVFCTTLLPPELLLTIKEALPKLIEGKIVQALMEKVREELK